MKQLLRGDWRLAATVLLAATSVAWGYTASEPFAYAPGTIITNQTGGSGFSSAWTGDADGSFVVTNLSLTYPGINASGYSALLTPVTTATWTIFRNLTQGLSNGVFYVGFLAQKLSANVPSRYFGVALFTNDVEMMLIGQGSGFSNWTANRVVVPLEGGGTTNTLESSVSSTTFSYLLVKLEINPVGNETVTFWVNPDLSLIEQQNTPVGGGSFPTDRDFGVINRIRIGGGGYSAPLEPSPHLLDEILITTNSPFAGPDHDFDGDGMSNLQEYLAGTDPKNSASCLRIKEVTREGDDIRIVWTAVGGKSYVVQTNSSPGVGFADCSEPIDVPGSGESVTNYVHVGAATSHVALFYRVRLDMVMPGSLAAKSETARSPSPSRRPSRVVRSRR